MVNLNFKKTLLTTIISFLLIISTYYVYQNISQYGFVNYDDPSYVSKNSNIRDGFTLKSIVWAFTTFSNGNWHPVTWLSHMLDIELFGMNAGYHHLINLFIHLCNTLLLFFIFRLSTNAIWKSAFLAAFFSLHPLRVESVAWISERKDLLCTFFWLLAMLAYYRYALTPSLKRYLFFFVFFILGTLSKPMMVTFPFALLLFDYWPLHRFRRIDLRWPSLFKKKPWLWLTLEKSPLILVSAIISGITLFSQSQGGSVSDLPFSMRLLNALSSYILYIKKMFWPGELAVIYPLKAPSLMMAGVGLIVILNILLISFSFRHRHGYLLFGFLWFFGTLIPVIGIIQVGSQAMADRYTYIPCIGFFSAVIWGVEALFLRCVKDRTLHKISLSIIAITALILMILLSRGQVRYWQNSISLMTNAVQVTENNYIAHENLGLALAERGMHDQALRHFQKIIAINPDFAPAYLNIGSYYFLCQKYDLAVQYYKKAIFLDPANTRAYVLLGKALDAAGKPDEAAIYFNKAHQLHPRAASLGELIKIERAEE